MSQAPSVTATKAPSTAPLGNLAALIAAVRGLAAPEAARVRSMLAMCEDDLLSAVDAIGKTVAAADRETPVWIPGEIPVQPAIPGVVAQKPRPTAGRKPGRRRPTAGQQSLFALA